MSIREDVNDVFNNYAEKNKSRTIIELGREHRLSELDPCTVTLNISGSKIFSSNTETKMPVCIASEIWKLLQEWHKSYYLSFDDYRTYSDLLAKSENETKTNQDTI